MLEFFQISFPEITNFEWILLSFFGAVFLLRIYYRLFFSLRILTRKKSNNHADNTRISLLLTVRNEEDNLKKCLPEILNLENENFEVVAIDDFSQDNTLSVLGVLKKENEKLRVSSLNQETRYSIKLSQNVALKAAKYDWVMVIPVSAESYKSEWLNGITKMLSNENAVVINYSNITSGKGLYNLLFQVENFMQQFKSAGYCSSGLPFVLSEENIAFSRNQYFEVGGYGQKVKEPFANLELIINKFAKKGRVQINFKAETVLRKNIRIKRQDYFELLKKEIRILSYLSPLKKLILFFDGVTKLFYIPLLIALFILIPKLWIPFLIASFIATTLYLFIIKILLNRLNERKLFISSLIYDMLIPYFKVFYRWHFIRRSRKQTWRIKT